MLSWQAVGLTEGFLRIICYSKQPISQRVTLLFFFAEKKKKAKKEKSSPTLVLYGNASHEDYTRNCHNRFSSTKLPRRGEQAAAAAVTLPFSQLKLGRKVSDDPPHAVTLPFSHLKLGGRSAVTRRIFAWFTICC
ncbi:hypothetical protein [Ruminococcus callidus]|uniref:hypothetical protein n=1 Tax=Ruminococcus callidus TaxID=40519 RepID=UPI003521DDAD